MAERVYPASYKPAGGSAVKPPPAFPASKAQLYGAARPNYRPHPLPRRRGRGCCCCCCLWITFFIFTLLILAAAASAAFWAIFRPQLPTYAVSAFRISALNATSSTRVDFRANLTVAADNPNDRIQILYDPTTLTVLHGGSPFAAGRFPAFVHPENNVTTLKAAISSSGKDLESGAVDSLKSDLKKKSGAPLTIRLDTRVGVKIGVLTTRKIGFRVTCDGIHASVPAATGKSPPSATATTSGAKCKVEVRVKIWSWTF